MATTPVSSSILDGTVLRKKRKLSAICDFEGNLADSKKKFPGRKVSAIRDFPPGCGRNINFQSVVQAYHRAARASTHSITPIRTSGPDLAGTLPNLVTPCPDPKFQRLTPEENTPSKSLDKDYSRKNFSRRRESAIRDYSPECGRFAATKQDIIAKLQHNETCDDKKLPVLDCCCSQEEEEAEEVVEEEEEAEEEGEEEEEPVEEEEEEEEEAEEEVVEEEKEEMEELEEEEEEEEEDEEGEEEEEEMEELEEEEEEEEEVEELEEEEEEDEEVEEEGFSSQKKE